MLKITVGYLLRGNQLYLIKINFYTNYKNFQLIARSYKIQCEIHRVITLQIQKSSSTLNFRNFFLEFLKKKLIDDTFFCFETSKNMFKLTLYSELLVTCSFRGTSANCKRKKQNLQI